jgi:hypothetical protein
VRWLLHKMSRSALDIWGCVAVFDSAPVESSICIALVYWLYGSFSYPTPAMWNESVSTDRDYSLRFLVKLISTTLRSHGPCHYRGEFNCPPKAELVQEAMEALDLHVA